MGKKNIEVCDKFGKLLSDQFCGEEVSGKAWDEVNKEIALFFLDGAETKYDKQAQEQQIDQIIENFKK